MSTQLELESDRLFVELALRLAIRIHGDNKGVRRVALKLSKLVGPEMQVPLALILATRQPLRVAKMAMAELL